MVGIESLGGSVFLKVLLVIALIPWTPIFMGFSFVFLRAKSKKFAAVVQAQQLAAAKLAKAQTKPKPDQYIEPRNDGPTLFDSAQVAKALREQGE